MKKILLFSLLFLLFIPNIYASTSSAYEYVLMDMTTGRVLDGKNYNKPRLIASITKIMTCVVAIESNKLDDMVVVDDVINDAYGSGIYIEVLEHIRLRDLLYGLMLRSGNDAALMIAKYVSGDVDKFVDKMNDKAREIGMVNTKFVNPSGLDEEDGGNYSTAYDMALLTKYAMEYMVYREIVSTRSYKVKTDRKTYVWKNKNKLIKYDYITGGKTGYTKKANRTLVSTASIGNIDLIVVSLNDGDDWNTHKYLYEDAFSRYKSYKFLDKKNFKVIKDSYYKGDLYINNNVYIPVLDDELSQISGKIELEKKNNYKTGDLVGYYNIYLNKDVIYKEKIYVRVKSVNMKNNSIINRIRKML